MTMIALAVSALNLIITYLLFQRVGKLIGDNRSIREMLEQSPFPWIKKKHHD